MIQRTIPCVQKQCQIANRRRILKMLKIKKEYVVKDDNKKKAVLVDIETFEKIEEILESFGLGKYMEEIEDEEILSVHNAKKYYSTLKKY